VTDFCAATQIVDKECFKPRFCSYAKKIFCFTYGEFRFEEDILSFFQAVFTPFLILTSAENLSEKVDWTFVVQLSLTYYASRSHTYSHDSCERCPW